MAEKKDILPNNNGDPTEINIYNQEGEISEKKIIVFLENNEEPRGKDKISKFYTLIKILLESGYSINENFIKNWEISNNGTIKEKLADAIKDNTHESERKAIYNQIKEKNFLLLQSRTQRLAVIPTPQETPNLNDEILSKTTAVNMRKAFEKIKDIDGYQKLILIEKILNLYIYKNSFLIVKWKNNTCIVMTENWEVQKDYTQALQQYLDYKDFQKHLSFSIQTSIGEGWYNAQVDEICKKHYISLEYEDDTQKMLLISSITNHQTMTPQEKRLLLTAIEWGYSAAQKDAQLLVDDYRKSMESALKNPELQEVTQAAWLQWTEENRDKRIRKPETFIGDLFKNMGPIGLFSIVWLIVGSLFGKKITGENSSFIMKLFIGWALIGGFQASGAWNLLADSWGSHGKEITSNISWSLEQLTKHVWTGIHISKTWLEKTASWWEFKNIKLNGDFIVENTNFEALYKQKSWWNLKGRLKNGKEKISDGLFEKLEGKIQELYNDWINKFGDEQQFFTAIEDKSIIEIIVIVNTPTEAPEAEAPEAPEAEAPAKTWEDVADLFN